MFFKSGKSREQLYLEAQAQKQVTLYSIEQSKKELCLQTQTKNQLRACNRLLKAVKILIDNNITEVGSDGMQELTLNTKTLTIEKRALHDD